MLDRRMPLFYHSLYTDGIHPEARFPRDRYRLIASRFQTEEARSWVRVVEAPLATRDQVMLAHDPTYVNRFLDEHMEKEERRRIGLRPWTPLLIPRTLRIMGGAIAGLKAVSDNGGFAANMAGGTHHAHYDWGSGYCVFNDLAICAQLARQSFGYRRVLVLDLDVHQGDGSATILAGEPSIFTVSVHCGTNFPFNKAQSDLDIEVEADADDAAFLEAVDAALYAGMSFAPDLVLFQGGVDALRTDKLGRLNVTRAGLQVRNERVYQACVRAKIPCVVFMGGGYGRPIETSVAAFYDLFFQAAQAHSAALG